MSGLLKLVPNCPNENVNLIFDIVNLFYSIDNVINILKLTKFK